MTKKFKNLKDFFEQTKWKSAKEVAEDIYWIENYWEKK